MNTEQKFYLTSGFCDKDFYENYIKNNVSKKAQKQFEAVLSHEEDSIYYYRTCISNPDDLECEFSIQFFFDINLGSEYMPVFIPAVNTSSCLSMELCNTDRVIDSEDEEEYEENNTLTLEELLEFVPNKKAKEALKKVLLMNK